MNAKELYQQAYHLQYKKKSLNDAYLLYHEILKEFPNEKESGYAKTQIENIENNPDFILGEEARLVKEKHSEELQKEKEYRENIEKERKQRLDKRENDFNNFFITTGYNFEGYRIVKYENIVSSDIVIGTGFLSELKASVSDTLGTNNMAFGNKIKTAKQMVLDELKRSAVNLDCNALIGINIEIVTFANNMIGVSGIGTAVRIVPAES